MTSRVLTAVGLSTLLGLTLTAHAAERACQVITDPAGDAKVDAAGSVDAAPELDLRSGLISVNGRMLTVTIRVSRTEAAMATVGERWRFGMSSAERAVELSATRGPDGVAFAAYGGVNQSPSRSASSYPYIGPISGRLDLPAGLVVMTAPLTQLGLRPTSVVSQLTLDSGQGVATSGEAAGGPLALTGQSLNQSTTTEADSAVADVRRSLNQRC